jgi:hypothetical protein
MKPDRVTKILLGIIVILLFINLVNSLFSSKTALAVSGNEDKGRFQISAWAAQTEGAKVHSGYSSGIKTFSSGLENRRTE